MRSRCSRWVLAAVAAVVLIGCVAAEETPQVARAQLLVGWYLQRAGSSTFQPCGGSERWQIGRAADLRARAKEFGLDDDTPIYVKLQATARAPDRTIDVVRVVQFGSPTPVRDCAMDGVVQQAAPGPR